MEKKNKFLKEHLVIWLKAFAIGGTMIVPGVSGGSMAVVLGVFDKLITAVSSFMRHKRQSALFLVEFSVFALAGIFLLTRPMSHLLDLFRLPMMYFFIGAVAGGIPLIIRKSRVERFSPAMVGYLVLGVALVLLLELLPEGTFSGADASGAVGFVLLIGAGFATAVALILPGISISYMLLVFGLYERVMKALSVFDVLYLLPLLIGLILGTILLARIFERVLREHPSATYITILGFIVGSVVSVFPGLPSLGQLPVCLLLAAAGFCAVYFVSRLDPG